MDEMEQRGYARMSDPTAAYAFYVHSRGFSLLNLRWLVEVIQQYEATAQKLADIPNEQVRLEFLRTVVAHVDDDRLARFMRQSDCGGEGDSLGQ